MIGKIINFCNYMYMYEFHGIEMDSGITRVLVLLLFLTFKMSLALSDPVLIHSYPRPDDFSYVQLQCQNNSMPAEGVVTFQLNENDIKEVNNTDTITFLLLPDREGEFTCSYNGFVSNATGLAAEPSSESYGQPKQQNVLIHNIEENQATTELKCEIQPGFLRERYSVMWKQLPSNNNSSTANITLEPLFNLTLNISSALNGSQYQCEVTINHNGSLYRSYLGGIITLLITAEAEDESSRFHMSSATIAVIVLFTIIPILLIPFGIIYVKKNIHRCNNVRNHFKTYFQPKEANFSPEGHTQMEMTDFYYCNAHAIVEPEISEKNETTSLSNSNESAMSSECKQKCDAINENFTSSWAQKDFSDMSSIEPPILGVQTSSKEHRGQSNLASEFTTNCVILPNYYHTEMDCGSDFISSATHDPIACSAHSEQPFPAAYPTTFQGAGFELTFSDHEMDYTDSQEASAGLPPTSSVVTPACTNLTQDHKHIFPDYCYSASQIGYKTLPDTQVQSPKPQKHTSTILVEDTKKYEVVQPDIRFKLSGSESQISTGTHVELLDSYPMGFEDGQYGYLPDIRYPHSLSQISTAGVGSSKVGIVGFDIIEQSGSGQKFNRTKKSKGKKGKRKPTAMGLDNKSGDSGIGQSLSPMKCLSPRKESHLLSLQDVHKTHTSSADISNTLPRPTRVQRSITSPPTMNKMRATTSCRHNSAQDDSLHKHSPRRRKKTHETISDSLGEAPQSNGSHKSVFQPIHIVPQCIRPTATLQNCTSAGLTYHDESNDLTLVIEEGAIATGDTLTIDIGMALYGPFLYPEGVRPVSPVFWICVRGKEKYCFLKPVKVTMQHFIKIDSDEDISLLGLSFMKGSHETNAQGKYPFLPARGTRMFEAKSSYGSFFTKHFCYQCIIGKVNEITLRNTNFCLFGTIPNTFVYDHPMYIFFFVTYFMSACLETVRKQILMIPELAYCKYTEAKTKFQFSDGTSNSAITIQLPHTLHGGWQIGLQLKKKISVGDIDFISRDCKVLQLEEEEGMYPPHFRVVINGQHTTQKATAHITFSGTANDFVFDIHLIPPTLVKGAFSSSQDCLPIYSHPLPYQRACLPPVILVDLLNFVAAEILSKWQLFGILLHLPMYVLDTFPTHNLTECFTRVFIAWGKRGQPEYTWETVLKILESKIMSEHRLAMDVRSKLALQPFPTPSYSLEPALSCPATTACTYPIDPMHAVTPQNLISPLQELHINPPK